MEHTIENVVKVLRAEARNLWYLYKCAREKYGEDSPITKSRISELYGIENAVRVLTDEQWFNEMAGIYEVAR